ncbi:hypothetical protein F5Y16DRAFT_377713 [Xylariaceae sp. FL0255]|nr:hypothetical protein F5Y16DRAFT_377713 [Xylariaceae sp. FL0255]
MSLSSPVPSKAAIHALRGLAFGTTCVIGVIIEDRRRRISTLKKVVANKEKLQSSRLYHSGGRDRVERILEDTLVYSPDSLRFYERQRREDEEEDSSLIPSRVEQHYETHHTQNNEPSKDTHHTPTPPPPLAPQPPPPPLSPRPPPTSSTALSSLPHHPVPIFKKVESRGWKNITSSSFQRVRGALPTKEVEKPAVPAVTPVTIIEDILASSDSDRIHRAASSFVNYTRPDTLNVFGDKWYELSALIGAECRAAGRLEDASRVLVATLSLGPIDESLYYTHEPMSLIRSSLAQSGANPAACGLALATKMFLARFPEKPTKPSRDIESNGRALFERLLTAKKHELARNVYMRTMILSPNPSSFVGWSIHMYNKHEDHHNAIKQFVLTYSKMDLHDPKNFDRTMDRVINSLSATYGLKLDQVADALARIQIPKDTGLRTRTLTCLVGMQFDRDPDLSKTISLFDKCVANGLMDRVVHPIGVLTKMINISARAGDGNMVRKYYDLAVAQNPDDEGRISMHLAMALWKARDEDWGAVDEIFSRTAPIRSANPTDYNNSFVPICKVYTQGRSTSEVLDFITRYMRDFHVEFTPHLVTLVAKLFSISHDVDGYITWLRHASKHGFPTAQAFCNAVLYPLVREFRLPYAEVQSIYSKFEALNPKSVGSGTRAILSASFYSHTSRAPLPWSTYMFPKSTRVDKTAYRGRNTNTISVCEAMKQQIQAGKYSAAREIYRKAAQFGMPFHHRCLALVIMACVRGPEPDPAYALSLIRETHADNRDVTLFVDMFIIHSMGPAKTGHATHEDLLAKMKQLIHMFEHLHLPFSSIILCELARLYCSLGDLNKASALIRTARDVCSDDVAFVERPVHLKAALGLYTRLLDVENLSQICRSMMQGRQGANVRAIGYMQYTRRAMRARRERPRGFRECWEVIEHTLRDMQEARARILSKGKELGAGAVRIFEESFPNPLAKMDTPESLDAAHDEWVEDTNDLSADEYDLEPVGMDISDTTGTAQKPEAVQAAQVAKVMVA